MTKLAVLIPEFPGQTHAFFMREKAEMEKMGAEIELLSTRRPIAKVSEAKHSWAAEAAAQTLYLSPLSIANILASLWEFLRAGPIGWWKCLLCILKADVSLKEKLTMFGLILVGAFLKRYCRQQDIEHIHVHSCANSANTALFNRLLGGVPYSMTLHGPMQDYGLNQAAKWREAAFVVVITKELIAEAQAMLSHIELPPLYLAPMGVNVEHFKRKSEYQAPVKGELLKLVSCGRIHPVKAHDDLIRAVAMLKKQGVDAELVVCGASDSQSYTQNHFQELKDLAEELGVTDQVVWLGSVSEERVRQALEEAHVFCLASLKEPLGVATMEAMAMSMPAVVARSPGVEEMVNDDVDGLLVNPRAPEEFVAAITRLLDTPEKATELSIQGRQRIVQFYHSGVSAKIIVDGIEKSK